MPGIKPYNYKVVRTVHAPKGGFEQVTGVFQSEEAARESIAAMRELVNAPGVNLTYAILVENNN